MNESSRKESKAAAKVYTRTGDKGTTSLFGGARVGKDDLRLEAYGTLDELNSVVGILISEIQNETWSGSNLMEVDRVKTELGEVQMQLFVLGSHLAMGTTDASSEQGFRDMLPKIEDDYVTSLETAMDRMSVALAPLKNFILPGGTRPAAYAHLARTVARRAERAIVAANSSTQANEANERIVKQVNRLNDYFFVLARHLNRLQNHDEPIWAPNK